MLVGEILIRKRYIERKIAELRVYVAGLRDSGVEPRTRGALYTSTISKLFELYSKLQNHNALLSTVNKETVVNIGDSEITVENAIFILKTVENKIKVLNEVISSKDYSLNVLELIEKRDSLMEEYVSIRKELDKNDWSKNVE